MIDLPVKMAKVLPDREIKSLLGTAILDGSPDCIRVNSYEIRLGHTAHFNSTGEEVNIPAGHYLEIEPGEFVAVESLERLDLTPETMRAIGKPDGVFAWITPTTNDDEGRVPLCFHKGRCGIQRSPQLGNSQ